MGVTRMQPPGKARERWQLRVELLDVSLRVWRRLMVPAAITLPRLHDALQVTLGWTNSHLHEFVIGGKRYAPYDPEWAAELKQSDERRVALNRALGPDARGFDYVYDFGDGWHHAVIVEQRYMPPASSEAAILCTDGENACPPEDVGGPPGYADFLAAIGDPRHEQHEEYLEWCGGRFDPTRFDRAAVNRALARLKA